MLPWHMEIEIIPITVSSSWRLWQIELIRPAGFGGEAISLAVKYKDSAAFKDAGYQELNVNASYVAGMVRQVGRLSFSRIFDAGQEGK